MQDRRLTMLCAVLVGWGGTALAAAEDPDIAGEAVPVSSTASVTNAVADEQGVVASAVSVESPQPIDPAVEPPMILDPFFAPAATRLSFQALLTDNGGTPLPGPTVDLEFNIYASGGALVEGPINVNGVPITGGIVDTAIPVSLSSFNGEGRWLGVAVDGGSELSPRTPLTMVPYAAKAMVAEGLVRPDTTAPALQAQTDGDLYVNDGRLVYPASPEPLIIAGHNNSTGNEKRLWIAHSESFPEWGLGYRDFTSDGFPSDAIEFYGGDATKPRLSFELFSGVLTLYDGTGDNLLNTVQADAVEGSGGEIRLRDSDGNDGIVLDADDGSASRISMANRSGLFTIELNADGGGLGGGETPGMFLRNGNSTADSVYIQSSNGAGGLVRCANVDGDFRVFMDGDENGGGEFRLLESDGSQTVAVRGNDPFNSGGEIQLFNSDNELTIDMDSDDGTGAGYFSLRDGTGSSIENAFTVDISNSSGAYMTLRNDTGSATIILDSDVGGDGRITTDELVITGGSDLSEQFDIRSETTEVKPGMVVSIDPANAGKLVVTDAAYDRKVAGVISGAGGIKPGMFMGQKDTVANGEHPVALTGRVYVWCDATNGAIEPGDLLTSSATPGHARKVTDYSRAHGAIIGKAMTPLPQGKGLVLVLVALQ